jgi:hypothetical protein
VPSHSLHANDSPLLTPAAFALALESEIKRAVRCQSYLTLVTVEASREWEGMTVTLDDGTLQDVAQVIGQEIRGTDLLSQTDKGMLGLLLLDADFDHTAHVIDRLIERIQSHGFWIVLRLAVGAACCPTHAVDVDSLKREALSRPLVSWKGNLHSSSTQSQPSLDQN